MVAVRSIPAASPAGSAGSYSGFPSYYASLDTSTYGNGDGSRFGPTIRILSTATGSMLTKLSTPSPYNTFIWISSDATANTFVFAMARVTRQGGEMEIDSATPAKFVMLRITPGGGTRLTTLPLSLPVRWGVGPGYGSRTFTSMAVSPDGSKLAVASGGDNMSAVVRVMTLATGSTRTWTMPHVQWIPEFSAQGAWAANDRTLAITVAEGPLGPRGQSQVRLLDTAAPGSSLASARSVVLQGTNGETTPVFITPNGAQLMTTGNMPTPARSRWNIPLLVFSARTGALLRTFGSSVKQRGIPTPPVFWSNPSGSKLVMFETKMHDHDLFLGVLTGNRFTLGGAPLPRGQAYERLSSGLSNDLDLMSF